MVSRDPVADRVDEMVRSELARTRQALEQTRSELAEVCRTKDRLEAREARLVSEEAGWAARAGGDA